MCTAPANLPTDEEMLTAFLEEAGDSMSYNELQTMQKDLIKANIKKRMRAQLEARENVKRAKSFDRAAERIKNAYTVVWKTTFTTKAAAEKVVNERVPALWTNSRLLPLSVVSGTAIYPMRGGAEWFVYLKAVVVFAEPWTVGVRKQNISQTLLSKSVKPFIVDPLKVTVVFEALPTMGAVNREQAALKATSNFAIKTFAKPAAAQLD